MWISFSHLSDSQGCCSFHFVSLIDGVASIWPHLLSSSDVPGDLCKANSEHRNSTSVPNLLSNCTSFILIYLGLTFKLGFLFFHCFFFGGGRVCQGGEQCWWGCGSGTWDFGEPLFPVLSVFHSLLIEGWVFLTLCLGTKCVGTYASNRASNFFKFFFLDLPIPQGFLFELQNQYL